MEGDKLDVDHNGKLDYFNPLPPHGGRHLQTDGWIFPKTFQSTPTAWRETNIDNVGYLRYRLISIHSLRMEGDHYNYLHDLGAFDISIHSLRMEGDLPVVISTTILHISIHSLRMEGDCRNFTSNSQKRISIHSLRMEGDVILYTFSHCFMYFNPLPPHGGRLILDALTTGLCIISIHSLRMEGDNAPESEKNAIADFNPLPPHGGRL